MAKRANVCKKDANVETGIITFTFNGKEPIAVQASDLPSNVLDQAVLHGLSQKLGDSYSGAQSVDEAMEAFNATLASLEAGQWNGGRAATGGLYVDAIANVQGITREEALERWNELDDAKKDAVKKVPRVKAEYARLLAERAKKAASGTGTEALDELLG